MNVISAIGGKEALKELEKFQEIHIVLLDMMIPNMDGYETAGRIRQDKRLKDLPITCCNSKSNDK